MNRPLMQHGVGQLEQLFAASKAESKVLKQLENELRYRQVPRAVSLLSEVQAALYAAKTNTGDGGLAGAKPQAIPVRTSAEPLTSPPVQAPLWTAPKSAAGGVGQESQGGPAGIREVPATKSDGSSAVQAPARPKAADAPVLTLTEALSLLKTTLGATWESVEQTRRAAVQSASPTRTGALTAMQLEAALANARRINAAYAVIMRERTSKRA